MQFEQLLRQSLIWRGFYFITVLLLNIVISRVLHADGSGWLYFYTTFFALVSFIVSLNIDSGIAFYASAKLMPKQVLSSFGLLISTVSSLVVIPILLAYFNIFPQQQISITQSIIYGLLYIFGLLLNTIFSLLFQAEKDFFTSNLWLGACNVLLVIILLFQNYINATNSIIATTYFIVFACSGVGLLVLYYINQKLSIAIKLPTKNQTILLLKYSLVALLGNLIFFLVYRIDYWFVKNACSSNNLGNYIQASKMGQLLLFLPQILASVLFASVANGFNKAIMKDNIIVISRLLIQLFVVIFIASLLFAKPIFILAFGNTFNNMYLPFLLLLPGILSLSILALLSAYFGGINKVKINVFGACIALFFVIIGNAIFTPKFGIVAAAIVSSIGYASNVLYAFFIFFKDDKLKFFSLLNWNLADYKWLKALLTNKLA